MHYIRNFQAIEKLLEFVQCDDIKRVGIAEFIINVLNDPGLNPKLCRAQTYDGAGNMASKEKDVVAKLCSETGNGKAVYFYCKSQKLKLSLPKAFQNLASYE